MKNLSTSSHKLNEGYLGKPILKAFFFFLKYISTQPGPLLIMWIWRNMFIVQHLISWLLWCFYTGLQTNTAIVAFHLHGWQPKKAAITQYSWHLKITSFKKKKRGGDRKKKKPCCSLRKKISFVSNAFAQNNEGLLCSHQGCAYGSGR